MGSLRNLALSSLALVAVLGGGCSPSSMEGSAPQAGVPGDATPDAAGDTPMLSRVTPAAGSSRGGVVLTLEGRGFTADSTVRIGGLTAPQVSVWSGTRITAELPTNPGALGPVAVEVWNPNGQATSRSDLFAYWAGTLELPTRLIADASSGAVGDWNGDRLPDVFLGKTLYLNNGRGGLAPLPKSPIPTAFGRTLASDVNGDGKLDLLGFGVEGVHVLLGDGKGGFKDDTLIPDTSRTPSCPVAVEDLNEDRRPDVIIAQCNSLRMLVLLNDGRGGFGARLTFSIGAKTSGIAVGDLTGDGLKELVVSDSETGKVGVFLNEGKSGFRLAAEHALGPLLSAVEVGDFDGKQGIDIVAMNRSQGLWFLYNDGTGGFGAPSLLPVSGMPWGLLAGDLNGDKAPDLAVACAQSADVRLFWGDGSGGFRTTSFRTQESPSWLSAADLDGDSSLDLLVGHAPVAGPSSVGLYRSDGKGSFGAPTYSTGILQGAMAVGDLDGDQRPDLAVSIPTESIRVLHSQGGRLVDGGEFPLGMVPYSLAAADLNGDTRPDLIASGAFGVRVLLSSGAGRFEPARSVPVTDHLISVTVADLNQDQKPDVVTCGSGKVYVLLGNGAGGLGPAAEFMGVSSMSQLAVGDLNQDKRPDVVLLGSSSFASFVAVMLGDGRGGLGSPVLFPIAKDPSSMVLQDLDRDGRIDVAVVFRGYDTPLQVQWGDGTGGFLPGPKIPLGMRLSVITAADLNGDGLPDLGAAGQLGLNILLNNGQRGFGAPEVFDAGGVPTSLVAADMNDDRRPDLAISSVAAGQVTLLTNLSF